MTHSTDTSPEISEWEEHIPEGSGNRFPEQQRKHTPFVTVCITWLMRIAVGAVFIFSGIVKAIDPWGSVYKIGEYLTAMHLDIWPTLLPTIAIALSAAEFLIGIFLVLGSFRRGTPVMGLAFMAVMLPLTAWIWIADPVSDCGCFGDAFIISNAATFWKNVALTLAFVWLLKYNRKVRCLVTPYLQWISTLLSAAFVIAISEIGYLFQPLVDFRPFPTGSALTSADFGDSGEEEFVFVYRKGNEEKIVAEDEELPDEANGWQFIETRTSTTSVGNEHKGGDLRIWNGDEDVTEDVIPGEGPKLWLFMPEIGEVSISGTWKINRIYDWCERHGVEMSAIVNGSPQQIEEWKDLSLAAYPVYTAEDTQIKEVVRGRQALVYTLDGDIIWKNTLQAVWQDGFDDDSLEDLSQLAHSPKRILLNISLIYLAAIVLLITASFSRHFLFRKTGLQGSPGRSHS